MTAWGTPALESRVMGEGVWTQYAIAQEDFADESFGGTARLRIFRYTGEGRAPMSQLSDPLTEAPEMHEIGSFLPPFPTPDEIESLGWKAGGGSFSLFFQAYKRGKTAKKRELHDRAVILHMEHNLEMTELSNTNKVIQQTLERSEIERKEARIKAEQAKDTAHQTQLEAAREIQKIQADSNKTIMETMLAALSKGDALAVKDLLPLLVAQKKEGPDVAAILTALSPILAALLKPKEDNTSLLFLEMAKMQSANALEIAKMQRESEQKIAQLLSESKKESPQTTALIEMERKRTERMEERLERMQERMWESKQKEKEGGTDGLLGQLNSLQALAKAFGGTLTGEAAKPPKATIGEKLGDVVTDPNVVKSAFESLGAIFGAKGEEKKEEEKPKPQEQAKAEKKEEETPRLPKSKPRSVGAVAPASSPKRIEKGSEPLGTFDLEDLYDPLPLFGDVATSPASKPSQPSQPSPPPSPPPPSAPASSPSQKENHSHKEKNAMDTQALITLAEAKYSEGTTPSEMVPLLSDYLVILKLLGASKLMGLIKQHYPQSPLASLRGEKWIKAVFALL